MFTNTYNNPNSLTFSNFSFKSLLPLLVFAACFFLVDSAFAQTGAAETKITKFFTDIERILKTSGIIIITIAIMFAGIQMAFGDKRFTEVMPVLLGGMIAGLATLLAGFFMTP